jgi:hypothetical protein
VVQKVVAVEGFCLDVVIYGARTHPFSAPAISPLITIAMDIACVSHHSVPTRNWMPPEHYLCWRKTCEAQEIRRVIHAYVAEHEDVKAK